MMNNTPISNIFNSQEALHDALIARICKELIHGIKTNGHATMAVSGGSTPKALFEKLSLADLPWEAVTVTLVDERWVDTESLESNEHLVHNYLLKNRAASASFVGLKTEAATAKEAEPECRRNIASLPTPLDVVILGMGTDGHTASFFPGAATLHEALYSEENSIAVTPKTAPYERMSMTRSFLLNTKALLLHIEGVEKWDVYTQALSVFSDGNEHDKLIETMPIRAMMNQTSIALEVYYTQG